MSGTRTQPAPTLLVICAILAPLLGILGACLLGSGLPLALGLVGTLPACYCAPTGRN